MLGDRLGILLGTALMMSLFVEGLLLGTVLGTLLGALLGTLLGALLVVGLDAGNPVRVTCTFASLLTNEVKVTVRVCPVTPSKLLIVYEFPDKRDTSAMEIFVSTDVSLDTMRTAFAPSCVPALIPVARL